MNVEKWIELIAFLNASGKYTFDEARAIGCIVNSFANGESRELCEKRLGAIAVKAALTFAD